MCGYSVNEKGKTAERRGNDEFFKNCTNNYWLVSRGTLNLNLHIHTSQSWGPEI